MRAGEAYKFRRMMKKEKEGCCIRRTYQMKRLICTILVIVVFSISAQAKYSGGSGTSGDPYQICSAEALLALAAETNDYDANFVLTADIDLSAYTFTKAVIASDTNNSSWEFDGVSFTGDFNGAGHIIRNLTIDTHGVGNDYLGLFGSAKNSRIRNLQMKNVRIAGGSDTYCIGGLAGGNMGDIINCSSTGVITSDSNSSCLGGLVGYNDGGDINICNSVANINGGFNVDWIGGLVGVNHGNISNSYATGNVTGGDYASDSLGGLVGYNQGTISNCSSMGAVRGGIVAYSLGGLVGTNCDGIIISNCYSTGAVAGGDNACFLGGLVGNNGGSINNSYSTGDVKGGRWSSHLGGLVGYSDSGAISSCYFLDTSGPNDGNGMPLTKAQMKQQASFVGWDFLGETTNGTNDIWTICEGFDYPKLTWVFNGRYPLVISKCSINAGTTDSISISGFMSASTGNFDDANNSGDANFVEITISAEDMSPCVITFPINGKTWKNGKFSYSGTVNGIKKSFSYVVKTGKFAFTASKLDLTGLECPLIVDINVGDFASTVSVDEAIVNGTKPIPINLLMGVKNSLRVDKSKFTKKSGNITQVGVSGGFSDKNVNDANLLTNPLDITVGSQTFTIPAGKFKNTKGKFTCSKVDTSNGIAAATFDFNKCTFTLTIKNTSFTAGPGTTNFDIDFASFSEGAEVSLP
jgi:hypothetical protein